MVHAMARFENHNGDNVEGGHDCCNAVGKLPSSLIFLFVTENHVQEGQRPVVFKESL